MLFSALIKPCIIRLELFTEFKLYQVQVSFIPLLCIIKNYKNCFKLLNMAMGYLSKFRLGIQFQQFLEKCHKGLAVYNPENYYHLLDLKQIRFVFVMIYKS